MRALIRYGTVCTIGIIIVKKLMDICDAIEHLEKSIPSFRKVQKEKRPKKTEA